MYLLIIFLVFISFFLSGLFGKYFGVFFTIKLSLFFIVLALILTNIVLVEVVFNKSPVYVELFPWINSELLFIKWSFIFDTLTCIMCFVVLFISMIVHLYSIEYMRNDPHLTRFYCYLSMFTFFMLILITADNFLQLFIGWEGVGLCSYLLINFWFTRIQANKAAIKAMILNRIGDFSLIIGVFIIFLNLKTLDFSVVFVLTPYLDVMLINFIVFFLFFGAVGKSAQLGLHTWLPDAMEGPTPVSALIHAATMVTAGIFLIIRVSYLFEYSNIKNLIIIIGVMTSFLSATIGLTQNDLKKVIAYSTCSQLGYMVFACGLSNYYVGLFHLINHAFFKALLFLSAGSVIHSMNDEQDMRKMGGLKMLLPYVYLMIFLGSMALIGFPFLTGFYSKDLILEAAYSKYNNSGFYSFIFGTLGAFFSAYYSARLIFLTFLSKPNGFKKIVCYTAESENIIKISLFMLSIPSIFFGFYSKDFITGLGTSSFFNSIYIKVNNFNLIDSEFVNVNIKILPVFFSILGFFLAFFFYFFFVKVLFKLKLIKIGKLIYNFFNKKWFIDKIYFEIFVQYVYNYSYIYSYKFLDRGIFEIFGPTGLSFFSLNFSTIFHNLQKKNLYHTLLFLLLSLVLILIIRELFFLNLIINDFLNKNYIFLNLILLFFFLKKN